MKQSHRMLKAVVLSSLLGTSLLAFASEQDTAWQQGESFGQSGANQIENTVKGGSPQVPGQNESYQAPNASGNLNAQGQAAMMNQADGQFLSQNMQQNPRTNIDPNTNTTVTKANSAQNNGDNLPANEQPYCLNNKRPDGSDCTSTTYQSFPESSSQIPANTSGDPQDSYSATDNFENQASAIDGLSEANPNPSGFVINAVRTFVGKNWQCRDVILGFDNCCKDSGWGQSIGLAGCNKQEKQLGQAKEKKLCHYVGEYCSKKQKITGICLEHKKSYCCFDSMLSRIIQEQGRVQIGLSFGDPDSADCSGLSASELQRIDFSKIDFSEYYQSLEAQVITPNQSEVTNMLNGDVNQMAGGG
jgi:hypothetical protein